MQRYQRERVAASVEDKRHARMVSTLSLSISHVLLLCAIALRRAVCERVRGANQIQIPFPEKAKWILNRGWWSQANRIKCNHK